MNRGMICIATGAYIRLLEPLVAACAETGFTDELFCLTDDDDLLTTGGRPRIVGSVTVHALPWGRLQWPLPALWQYHAIDQYRELFTDRVSHLIFSDVDMRPLQRCDALFADTLVAVRHPGYWNSPVGQMPFERNPDSTAFVPATNTAARYVAGAMQGGPVALFTEAATELKHTTYQDFSRGIVATWHDESQWNAYVARHNEAVTILGPEYCWPESWPVPDGVPAPLILALDKDHHALRGTKPTLAERVRPTGARLRRWAKHPHSLLRAHE